MSPATTTFRVIFFLMSTLFPVINLDAQILSIAEGEAIKAFEQGDFEHALSIAESLLAINNERVDALFVAGESAFRLGFIDLAEVYFSKIPEESKTGFYSTANLRLARVKFARGNCADAQLFLKKYLLVNPNPNDIFFRQVKQEIANCKTSEPESFPAESSPMVSIQPLGVNINTPYSEVAPQRFADKFYFTSATRLEGSNQWANRVFSVIREEQPIIAIETPKQASLQVGNAALTPQADKVYYTICKDNNPTTQEQCEIWYRNRTYEGNWSHPIRLPRHVNLPGYSATHPNIGFDRLSNSWVLYFASNRPGGKGKFDIWSAAIDRVGNFSEPVCLPFNTGDDEITPFFYTPTQSLYFSSNREQGAGGFDIYSVGKAATNTWTAPRLVEGINTQYDEIHFYLYQNKHIGYFASNRPNATCPKSDGTCSNFDLYEVQTFAILDLSIFNAADSTALMGCTIELLDLETGKIDSTYVRVPVNQLKLFLNTGKALRLIVSQPGYFPVYTDIESKQLRFSATLEKSVFLKPMHKSEASE